MIRSFWLKIVFISLLLIGIVLFVIGIRPEANVNAYLTSLPSWSSFSPLKENSEITLDNPSEPFQEIVSDTTYDCTTTPYSLTRTPDKIVMYSPNASVMWLGNLIQGKSYADGLGSLQELSIRQRAPLKISIDLLTGNNFVVVDDPSLTTVQSAIGELIQKAEDAGHKGGSDASFTMEETHAIEQAILKLGFSANYLGAKAKADLSYEKSASEKTITAHFVQKLFTVSVELPQNPSDFFSDALTDKLLQQQINAGNLGTDNLPVYIANIAYGRILTFNFTSTYEAERIRAAISGSYQGVSGGGSGYTEGELRDTLNTAKINITVLGGENASIESLIRGGNLRDYFVGDPALTSARPISYQLNNLRPGNPIAKVSETTSYSLKECTARPKESVKIGEKVRITLEHVVVHDDCDPGDGEVYGEMSINGSRVWELKERSTAAGTSIAINHTPLTKDYFFERSDKIRISGFLSEADPGNDDKIGSWDLKLPPFSSYGTKSNRSEKSNPVNRTCASTLHYNIEKVQDLFDN